MSGFWVPVLSLNKIREEADKFRTAFSDNEIPVDILKIVEFKLNLELRPVKNLKAENGIDAFISSNFEIIFVDSDELVGDDLENRLRFSIAHEIGHYILHKDFYGSLNIKTIEDYLVFLEKISEKDYRFLEWHAHEFAGRLLVPHERLHRSVKKAVGKVPEELLSSCSDGLLAEYLAIDVAPEFGVSQEVIERRIEKENAMNNRQLTQAVSL